MNKFEKLEQEAFDKNVKVHNRYLGEPDLKGLYIDGNIALNTSLETSTEKTCIMAEELGHHYTSVGNILDVTQEQNAKQERKARLWAYNNQIGLQGILDAYESGCQNMHDAAAYLEVTEQMLLECIECYREKYGVGVTIKNYYIMFIPHLAVGKLYSKDT